MGLCDGKDLISKGFLKNRVIINIIVSEEHSCRGGGGGYSCSGE